MEKIYESPDGGKTVYQREAGSSDRELVKSSNDSDRSLFTVPERFIKDYPNDAELGYAVRAFYWHTKGK